VLGQSTHPSQYLADSYGVVASTLGRTAARGYRAFHRTDTNSDTDSLKTTPNGSLVLTSEGDGPGSGSNGVITLISNPGTPSQSVQNVLVTDGHGNNVQGMDDVLFPSATSGDLFFTDGVNNDVYEAVVSGLDPNTPIASLASFGELGLVNMTTGVATPFITGADVPGGVLSSPHGIDFIPARRAGAGEHCSPGRRLREPPRFPAAYRLAVVAQA
jgi:hypothetical protein